MLCRWVCGGRVAPSSPGRATVGASSLAVPGSGVSPALCPGGGEPLGEVAFCCWAASVDSAGFVAVSPPGAGGVGASGLAGTETPASPPGRGGTSLGSTDGCEGSSTAPASLPPTAVAFSWVAAGRCGCPSLSASRLLGRRMSGDAAGDGLSGPAGLASGGDSLSWSLSWLSLWPSADRAG